MTTPLAQQHAATMAALNRLGKWRSALTGRILGTRAKGDPESDGFRDLFDKLLLLRAEVTAITGLLLEKGVFTDLEFLVKLEEEAKYLTEAYEKQFPGFRATDYGLDIDIAQASQTMRKWPA